MPLNIVGAAGQSADYFDVTSNGGTTGDIFKINQYKYAYFGVGVVAPVGNFNNIYSNANTLTVANGNTYNNTLNVTAGVLSTRGTFTGSSTLQVSMSIEPTYNQTSTAAGTDLLINRTETSVGSGAQLFLDMQVGGVSKAKVDHLGAATFASINSTGLTQDVTTGAITLTAGAATTTPLSIVGATGQSVPLLKVTDASSNSFLTIDGLGQTAMTSYTADNVPLTLTAYRASASPWGYALKIKDTSAEDRGGIYVDSWGIHLESSSEISVAGGGVNLSSHGANVRLYYQQFFPSVSYIVLGGIDGWTPWSRVDLESDARYNSCGGIRIGPSGVGPQTSITQASSGVLQIGDGAANANGYLHAKGFTEDGTALSAKYLGITATASDSTKWNNKTMPADAQGALTNDGSGNLSFSAVAGSSKPSVLAEWECYVPPGSLATYSRIADTWFYGGWNTSGSNASLAQNTASASDANHPGVLGAIFNGANSGVYVLTCPGASTAYNMDPLLGTEKLTFVFRAFDLSSLRMRIGFMDGVTDADPTYGAYIYIVNGIITAATKDDANTQSIGGTTFISTDTWYRAEIEVNADASSVTFTIYTCSDGQVLWTGSSSTYIPTHGVANGIKMWNPDGSYTGQKAEIDYLAFQITRTLTR